METQTQTQNQTLLSDILSQAIAGEIVGMSNFAKLTGTIDDLHERLECIEHANGERQHAEGFMELAAKYELPVLTDLNGTYWTRVRMAFEKYSDKRDFIACIIMQEVILECFAVSMYKDVGTALQDTEIGQLFLEISTEEEEHIEHSIEILRAELAKDEAGFIAKVEEVHTDCMTILAEWTVLRPCDTHCAVCQGECMKSSLGSIGLDMKSLRGNALNLYLKTLDRIGVPPTKSLTWVLNLTV